MYYMENYSSDRMRYVYIKIHKDVYRKIYIDNNDDCRKQSDLISHLIFH